MIELKYEMNIKMNFAERSRGAFRQSRLDFDFCDCMTNALKTENCCPL